MRVHCHPGDTVYPSKSELNGDARVYYIHVYIFSIEKAAHTAGENFSSAAAAAAATRFSAALLSILSSSILSHRTMVYNVRTYIPRGCCAMASSLARSEKYNWKALDSTSNRAKMSRESAYNYCISSFSPLSRNWFIRAVRGCQSVCMCTSLLRGERCDRVIYGFHAVV